MPCWTQHVQSVRCPCPDGLNMYNQLHVHALHALLVDCNIASPDEQWHALANQLVVGCRNRETSQKLLLSENLISTKSMESWRQKKGHLLMLLWCMEVPCQSSVQSVLTSLNLMVKSHLNANSWSMVCTNCGRRGHATYDQRCPSSSRRPMEKFF